ncbi:MAG: hypothetical protein JSW65_06720 [Candidatus Bipolaricaulota bacterium]|nr:MAG: hypothetical protein JSW65_06720 [Candidatus Bipolaricaulota bacterium]
MIERVHQHIVTELQQGSRTDIVFVITAVLLNLLTLGINSSVAQESRESGANTIVMALFILLTIVINVVATLGLLKGKETRAKLLEGLLAMYADQGVDGYYDASLLSNYGTRYNLFILAVVFMGIIAIAVPLVVR